MKPTITFFRDVRHADSSPLSIGVADNFHQARLEIQVARFSEPPMSPATLPDFTALQTTLSIHLYHPTACRLLADELAHAATSLYAMADKMANLMSQEKG